MPFQSQAGLKKEEHNEEAGYRTARVRPGLAHGGWLWRRLAVSPAQLAEQAVVRCVVGLQRRGRRQTAPFT